MKNTSQVGKGATKSADEKLCRVCSITLLSDAEYRIGVHVRCVYNAGLKFKRVTIPGPSYGNKRQQSDR